jgi:hypothetical protein
MRPRKYFTIPKESLERFLDDVEQLLNFFVIEFQRVLFAENIWATLLVCELLRGPFQNFPLTHSRLSSLPSSPTS